MCVCLKVLEESKCLVRSMLMSVLEEVNEKECQMLKQLWCSTKGLESLFSYLQNKAYEKWTSGKQLLSTERYPGGQREDLTLKEYTKCLCFHRSAEGILWSSVCFHVHQQQLHSLLPLVSTCILYLLDPELFRCLFSRSLRAKGRTCIA